MPSTQQQLAIPAHSHDAHSFDDIFRKVWDQLDSHIWPSELAEIKPLFWESMDVNHKGKAVLESLSSIIYHVTELSKHKAPETFFAPVRPAKASLGSDASPFNNPLYP